MKYLACFSGKRMKCLASHCVKFWNSKRVIGVKYKILSHPCKVMKAFSMSIALRIIRWRSTPFSTAAYAVKVKRHNVCKRHGFLASNKLNAPFSPRYSHGITKQNCSKKNCQWINLEIVIYTSLISSHFSSFF